VIDNIKEVECADLELPVLILQEDEVQSPLLSLGQQWASMGLVMLGREIGNVEASMETSLDD
jgi:hypothetical protein